MSDSESIFIHPDVDKVRSLHRDILSKTNSGVTIYELLEELAENLFTANQSGDERSFVEGRNYLKAEEMKVLDGNLNYSLSFCHLIMARQHGYQDWEEVKLAARILPEEDFEKAVEAIISGEKGTLIDLLEEKPHLVLQRSSYQHKAGLIHYIAANGVELRRQVVPYNLPEIVQSLLDHGADPMARGFFYGKMMSALELLNTGTHAREAGVHKEVYQLLQ